MIEVALGVVDFLDAGAAGGHPNAGKENAIKTMRPKSHPETRLSARRPVWSAHVPTRRVWAHVRRAMTAREPKEITMDS